MLISLIIPCFNEEEALPLLYPALCQTMEKLPDFDFELLFVNDGSRDGTMDVLRRLARQDPRVQYLSFSRNFGKEAAMYAGFCNAQGDYVAVMDADMQDPPSLLPQMVERLQTGEWDSVATRRVTRKGEPPIRSFCARMFYKLINRISDADVVDGARDFRLMTREMVDAIVSMGDWGSSTGSPRGFLGGLAFGPTGCPTRTWSGRRGRPSGAFGSCSSTALTALSISPRSRCPSPPGGASP